MDGPLSHIWWMPVYVTSLWLLTSCQSDDVTEPLPFEERFRLASQRIVDVGPRQVATPGEDAARDAVLEMFVEVGLAPSLDPFVFDAWRPGTATVTVGGESRDVEAFSPTPRTHIEAVLRTEGDDLEGSLAVLSSLTGERAEHFLRAASEGALGLVRITDELDHDGSPLNEVGHTLQGSSFPAVGVDQPTGDWLRARLGQVAHLDVEPEIAVGHVSTNVMARVEGQGPGTVYVVAHYDSWHSSHSAFDNAIGVGTLVAIAEQVFRGPKPQNSVVFLATTAEEQGLRGAFAWTDAHGDEVLPGDRVVTLDVVWSGEGRYLCMGSTEAERQVAVDAALAEQLDVVKGGDPGVASDHFPFVLQGATATWCGRWPDRHYHTHRDVLSELNLTEAEAAARVQLSVVQHWMGNPS